MALGFMKNVFTFGRKQAAEESKPEDAIAPSEAEAVTAGEDAEAAPAEETPVATETLAEAKSADPWDDDSIVGGVVGPGSKPQQEAENEAEALPAAETHEAEPEPRPVPAEEPEETVPAEAASAETADAPKADSPAEQEKPAEAPEQPAIRNQGFEIVTGRKAEAPAPQPTKRQTWFQRLRAGLFRTSQQLSGQIAALFTKRKLDEDALEELEDLLIQADLGVETAMRITDTLSSERYGKDVSGNDVVRIMAGEITKVLTPVAKPLQLDLSHKPHVILVVGVNGTGKTTTIGKLAAKLTRAGLKVTLGAGDTFRAAAIEQLKIWSERTGAEFVGTKLGADAAGLAYDAFKRGQENGSDVVIIDTAGRLQNKAELMDELAKIVRVLGKLDPDAPHTVLQTLDATTGQNAMNQVEIFRNIAGVSGLVMTKLDGTARGGILVAIAAKHKLPVYFIGVGEGIDDLEPFEAAEFAEAIAGRQVEEQD
ncbi:signal recognition particle-docking protein FtsY [Martelella mediterranea]|uniref:Signal recognition particle receptor FtsY n=1 Tax=Martelella mediterranea DSM 17316 TaxID=1122214 RepID=A0A1U9Z731_9HYPH|nr:signal recognition particle-docking protein FtsY [Martelella mediterranea]AQZ53527.1 Signal recognition particle receptor FtsY [Martelella mediterranea DSM 17316]